MHDICKYAIKYFLGEVHAQPQILIIVLLCSYKTFRWELSLSLFRSWYMWATFPVVPLIYLLQGILSLKNVLMNLCPSINLVHLLVRLLNDVKSSSWKSKSHVQDSIDLRLMKSKNIRSIFPFIYFVLVGRNIKTSSLVNEIFSSDIEFFLWRIIA